MTESKKDSMKDMFNSFLSQAQAIAKTAVETAKDGVEKGKDIVEDHLREREANEIYRKLGKKVYKLVSRNELDLPECCSKYIEALADLYDEEDRDDSGEQEACVCDGDKCECKCDGDKCECKCDGDKCECKCDGDKCECKCDGDKCECKCDGDKCECKCDDDAK